MYITSYYTSIGYAIIPNIDMTIPSSIEFI